MFAAAALASGAVLSGSLPAAQGSAVSYRQTVQPFRLRASASCPEVIFLGARGSGETTAQFNAEGPNVAAISKAMHADLSARHISFASYGITDGYTADAVSDFILAHDQVFLIEQNRDAQMRMLLVNECGIDPARFVSVLHFDGAPITARFISEAITSRVRTRAKEAAE